MATGSLTVDVDQTLANLVSLLSSADALLKGQSDAEALELLNEFVEEFSALNDWLCLSGYLPNAWRDCRKDNFLSTRRR